MSSDWGMLYIVEKIILRAIKYFIRISQKNWFEKNMNVQNLGITRILVLRLPLPTSLKD
jgi:hypothetical protein